MSDLLRRWRRFCWWAGALGIACSMLGLLTDRRMFFASYLEGYLICLGLTLGCLGIWIIHSLVGGQWGDPIDRIVQSAARALPWMALLFIPILLGMKSLFLWTDVARMRSDEVLSQKIWYLNAPFFLFRAIGYFAIWMILLRGLKLRSERATKDPMNPWTLKLQNWSGAGALVLFVSASFAVIDWVLSLAPYFYSTIWGPLVLMGMLLGSFSFCALAAIFLRRQERRYGQEASIPDVKLNDVGNLMLMSLILWMYMTFSQYLIIWSGRDQSGSELVQRPFHGRVGMVRTGDGRLGVYSAVSLPLDACCKKRFSASWLRGRTSSGHAVGMDGVAHRAQFFTDVYSFELDDIRFAGGARRNLAGNRRSGA